MADPDRVGGCNQHSQIRHQGGEGKFTRQLDREGQRDRTPTRLERRIGGVARIPPVVQEKII